MTKLITLLIFVSPLVGLFQSFSCNCYNGIGSSKGDTPEMTIELKEGMSLAVCGYVQKRLSDNEIFISEFNIFDCRTGKTLIEYGPSQNCVVKSTKDYVQITEFKFLPADSDWNWRFVRIGTQKIFTEEGNLTVSKMKPDLEKVKINKASTVAYFEKLRTFRETGRIGNPEEILGRLEILALNGSCEASKILYDFEEYFNLKADGAIAEQWKDAIATVKWIRNK